MVSRLPLRPCSLPISAPACPPAASPRRQRASCSRLVRLRVRMTELWESFSENLLRTRTLFTEKTTYMQDETDGTPNGGEISQRTCIPTLDVRRLSPTGGAGSHGRRGTQGQGDLKSYLYLFNLDIRKVGKNDHRMSLGPQKWKGKTKKCSIS